MREVRPPRADTLTGEVIAHAVSHCEHRQVHERPRTYRDAPDPEPSSTLAYNR